MSANLQRIEVLLTQKIVIKLPKIWVLGSGGQDQVNSFPDPGSRGQKDTGFWIRYSGFTKAVHRNILQEHFLLMSLGNENHISGFARG